jgi:hypothetical protein
MFTDRHNDTTSRLCFHFSHPADSVKQSFKDFSSPIAVSGMHTRCGQEMAVSMEALVNADVVTLADEG